MFHDIFVSLSSNNSVVSMSNSLSARLTYRIMAVVLVRMVTRDRFLSPIKNFQLFGKLHRSTIKRAHQTDSSSGNITDSSLCSFLRNIQ